MNLDIVAQLAEIAQAYDRCSLFLEEYLREAWVLRRYFERFRYRYFAVIDHVRWQIPNTLLLQMQQELEIQRAERQLVVEHR
jgi:hypothetical protein